MKFWTQYILMIVLIGLTTNASAINCNQQSPKLKGEGDSYYDINKSSPPTRQQKSKISKMLSSFKGKKLNGNSTVIGCTNSRNNPKKTIKKGIITANIKYPSGEELVISVTSTNQKEGTSYNSTLRYFGSNQQYHIDKLTNNKLVISSKYRNARIFNEEITDISIKNKSLIIKVTRYSNGDFANQHIRKLNL